MTQTHSSLSTNERFEQVLKYNKVNNEVQY